MDITLLKILAVILMTIDHIGAFIPGMPIVFRWIGRLSAPVFLFCVLEGIEKTSNRKKYILRLYLFSLGMAAMDVAINKLMPDYPILDDDIFLVYFGVAAFVSILEWSKNKYKSVKKGFLIILLWQIGVPLFEIVLELIGLPNILSCTLDEMILHQALAGLVLFWKTNTQFIIFGVLLYFCKHDKSKFIVSYIVMSLLPSLLIQVDFFQKITYHIFHFLEYSLKIPEILFWILEIVFSLFIQMIGFDPYFMKNLSFSGLWESNYQWMMIGALPIFMLYNGKKGKGWKYFFYVYYPLHILILAWMRIL